jgi:hypothetical protein
MRPPALALLLCAPALFAQDAAPEGDGKINVALNLAIANVNDRSLQFSNGREHQTKMPYAVLGVFGDFSKHISYLVELDAASDSMTPQPFSPTAATPFYFPNAVDPAYGVTSNPEGFFKVDDYKNTGWNPYIEPSPLRRGYVDVHTADRRFGLVAGRFFVPVGFNAEEFTYITSKDLTHIQLIDSAADEGFEGYWGFGKPDAFHGRLVLGAVSGNGDPYHDYVYFDFTGTSTFEDTNSAVAGVFQLRLDPVKGLELALSAKLNYVGSLITEDVTVFRSKHYDNAYVFGARYRPPALSWAEVFGEAASYKWGLRDTSASLLPGPPNESPINKNGFYAGFDVAYPVFQNRFKLGLMLTYESLDRDDSLIAYLAANNLMGVTLGKKETSTIVKAYADFGNLTAFFFYNDLHNPFPQVSAIEPIAGPFAYGSPGNSKIGFGLKFQGTVYGKGKTP